MLFKKENGIYYRRPLFLTLTVILAACALCVFLSGKEKIYCALVLSALSLLSLLFLLLPSFQKATVLFISFTLLFASAPLYISYCQIDLQAEKIESDEIKNLTFRAKEALTENSYGATYCVTLTAIEDTAVSCDAMISIDSANKPKANEKIKVKGRIKALKDENFGAYYMADGVLFRIEAEEFISFEDGEDEFLSLEKPPVATMFSNLYKKSLGGEEGALMSAVFLGDMSSLHESTSLSFRRLGISHLIAVSGMHITILIYGIERLLRHLTFHKHIRSIVCVTLLFAYLAIIGFPTSAVRAALMYLVVVLSYYFRGRYDSMTALAFVAVLMCLLSPYTVYDAAFWLSVMATAGVLAIVSKNEPKNPNAPRVPKIPIRNFKTFVYRVIKPLGATVKASFLVTFGAICATFPITAFLFGEMSVFAAPATLLLSPMIDFLLYGALFLPFLSFIPLVPWILKAVANLALFLIDLFSSFDFALISLKNPLLSYSLLVLSLILVLTKVFPLEKKSFRVVLNSLLAFAFISVITVTLILPLGERSLTYERKSSSESIFLHDKGECSLFLFDTIDSNRTVAQLEAYECTYLHRLCLTGYVETVYIRLNDFVSSVKTEEILLPFPQTNQEAIIAEKVKNTLDPHGVLLSFYEKDKPFALKNGIVWTDYDCEDNRQTFSLNAYGSRAVYTVPIRLDSSVSLKAKNIYRKANVLIFGRRWTENGSYLETGTALPDLNLLINANAYGGIRVPSSDEHHFEYKTAPTLVRYSIP